MKATVGILFHGFARCIEDRCLRYSVFSVRSSTWPLLYPHKHRKRDGEIEEENEDEDEYDHNQLEVDSAVGQHELGLISALSDRASSCELCAFICEKVKENFDKDLSH